MRKIHLDRKRKRGCGYCLDFIPSGKVGKRSKCPYDECPYHELDDVKTYDEYAESVSDTPIAEMIAWLLRRR